ncbi:MAG: hypothetical protein R3E89_10860 [Thiolinea sp.]
MELEAINTRRISIRRSINLNYGAFESAPRALAPAPLITLLRDETAKYKANEIKARAGYQLNDIFYVEGGVGQPGQGEQC